jgi:RNA recognition motif-containing protein
MKLYVGNLSFDITERTLRELFEKFSTRKAVGSARMIWAAISPSLSSAKKTALRVGSVAAQNGLAHQVFGCGAFFSLKAAQVALQPLGVGSKEKVALAQLAQVVGSMPDEKNRGLTGGLKTWPESA